MRSAADNFRREVVIKALPEWPLTYGDMAPYYSIVEDYIGVAGRLRVSKKQARMVRPMRTANLTQSLHGRPPCHYRGPCERVIELLHPRGLGVELNHEVVERLAEDARTATRRSSPIRHSLDEVFFASREWA